MKIALAADHGGFDIMPDKTPLIRCAGGHQPRAIDFVRKLNEKRETRL